MEYSLVFSQEMRRNNTRSFARDDFSLHHPGEADGVVADVDVLLNLADSLRNDFAHLKTDEFS